MAATNSTSPVAGLLRSSREPVVRDRIRLTPTDIGKLLKGETVRRKVGQNIMSGDIYVELVPTRR